MPENAVNPDVINDLRKKVDQVRTPHIADQSPVSSGCGELDQLLPAHGFERGTLIECLVSDRGSGAMTFSMLVARQACLEGGALVVLDRQRQFYPPAAAAWGIDLEKLILIQPHNEKDEHWAIDQALRCTGVSVVWASIDRLSSTTFRRWQLAAESSGCLGLLLRPAHVQGQPSWSDMQLLVQSLPSVRLGEAKARLGNSSKDIAGFYDKSQDVRRMRVQLTRSRGQNRQDSVELEIDQLTGELRKARNANRKTHSLHLAAQLAHPKTRRRSTGT
jgi:hypothetical protein